MTNKYREYLDIDEEYFPQVNDSSIAAASPDFWTRTYPHKTFIDMLEKMERILARQEMRSLWIEGAYGTGKSQCVYALKKILDVSESDLRAYWERYEPLRKKTDLLEKLIGHKNKGVVTAYRYASGNIGSPRELFMSLQESIKVALEKKNLYVGENTLKDSVIAWIDKPHNKRYIDDLLAQPEYSSVFSQSSADEILNTLRKSSEIKNLISNLFRLADKEGVTALNIDADRLQTWIKDVIDQNNIKIVFIWDEFSDYFKNNQESLSEFQKIAELVNDKPFYFIVVTHESGQLVTIADTTWKKVRDRFMQIEISLPDNIAFDLIGHAFSVKEPAKINWEILADDLNTRINTSRKVVMEQIKISNPNVIKNILPIHPMAALLLKNISSAFKSNQRSMFDFIKMQNVGEVKAFQWFIENTGPEDDHPLLTVDMLWNFFYENGRENLTTDIRLVLDIFPQQRNLRVDEEAVLKAILIMQAIDQRLGGTIDLFKATDQNLSYVFEGITSGLDDSCKNIAKQLVSKGILVTHPISGGRDVYTAAVLAGDQAKIDRHKKDIQQNNCSTAKLVSEGNLATTLSLSPAVRLRFESEPGTGKINPVTVNDFTRTINSLKDKPMGWNFHAVLAFAKDDAEASVFRKMIKSAAADEQYKTIVFIDSLSTPLGNEALEQYIEYSAMSMYYNGNNNTVSKENADKARRVLDQDWKNRLYNSSFIVYSYENLEGEKASNGHGVESILQTIVIKHFPDIFDFNKGITENQLKLTQAKASAKNGIMQVSSGVMVGVEKNILHSVWAIDKYWEHPATISSTISKIKRDVDKKIQEAFEREGQISIGEIYDFLEQNYGFAPCNLASFLTGFLLKEYSGDPYRYADSSGGHESMSQDKLAEMIGNYIGKNPKPTYIVKMTEEERAFYDLTEKAWDIPANSLASISHAINVVSSKMRSFGLPIWCLAEIENNGAYEIVAKYIELVQKEGNEAHKKAIEIGSIASKKVTLSENMGKLLTRERCQEGMREFLRYFEKGKILTLAEEIKNSDNLLTDIRALFEIKYSCLWDKKIGEDEIRKLLDKYSFVKESNKLLKSDSKSQHGALNDWKERIKFINASSEALSQKFPSLVKIFDMFQKTFNGSEVLSDQLKVYLSELREHGDEICGLLYNDTVFKDIYSVYLEDFNDSDINEIKSRLPTGMFQKSKTDCNALVKQSAEEYRKNQLKTQLFELWKEKTGTRNPKDWSNHFKTPILCCVPENEFTDAKKVFDSMNRQSITENEIQTAFDFLKKTKIFNTLSDEKKRNEHFDRDILGVYKILLRDLNKIREKLEKLNIDVYEWRENPTIKAKIQSLAEAEYNSGGSNKALAKIDELNDANLKNYLKLLVKENMTVGIEIMSKGNKE